MQPEMGEFVEPGCLRDTGAGRGRTSCLNYLNSLPSASLLHSQLQKLFHTHQHSATRSLANSSTATVSAGEPSLESGAGTGTGTRTGSSRTWRQGCAGKLGGGGISPSDGREARRGGGRDTPLPATLHDDESTPTCVRQSGPALPGCPPRRRHRSGGSAGFLGWLRDGGTGRMNSTVGFDL